MDPQGTIKENPTGPGNLTAVTGGDRHREGLRRFRTLVLAASPEEPVTNLKPSTWECFGRKDKACCLG